MDPNVPVCTWRAKGWTGTRNDGFGPVFAKNRDRAGRRNPPSGKRFYAVEKSFLPPAKSRVQEAGKKAQENLTRTRESSGWKGPELFHQVFDLVGFDGD